MAINYREIQQLPPFTQSVDPNSGTAPSGTQYGMETALAGQNPTGAARKLTLGMIYSMFSASFDEGFNNALIQSISYSETNRTITVTLRSGDSYTANPIPVAGTANPNPGLITSQDWNLLQQLNINVNNLVTNLGNLDLRVTVLEGEGKAYYVTNSQWDGGFTGAETPNDLQTLFTTVSGKTQPNNNDIMVHVASATSWVWLNGNWAYIERNSFAPSGSQDQIMYGDGTVSGHLDKNLNDNGSGRIDLNTSFTQNGVTTFKGICVYEGGFGIATSDINAQGASGSFGIGAGGAGLGFNAQGASGSFGIGAGGAGLGFNAQGAQGSFGINCASIQICSFIQNSNGNHVKIGSSSPNASGGTFFGLSYDDTFSIGLDINYGKNDGTKKGSLKLFGSYAHNHTRDSVSLTACSMATIADSIFTIGSTSRICACQMQMNYFGGFSWIDIPNGGYTDQLDIYGPAQYYGSGFNSPLTNIPSPPGDSTKYGNISVDYTVDKLKVILRVPYYDPANPRTLHLAASRPNINTLFASDSGWV